MLYILILLLGGAFSYFGPWWTIAPVSFVICFCLPQKPSAAFWTSAFAGVTLWVGYSVYLHIGADTDLTARVAGIFTAGVPALADMPAIALVVILATLVVAPVSGFAGLAGVKIRQLIRSSL
ncbi:hypothetical protein [Parapedobacter indicus]|uniref:Uncharacterized protein n=1 Tax=Parapedobacter indicus TaxID=1477437 RepID=A0A1I3IDM2_9SPHI|nr:hypothetical protein [Parapedobacter indicus]PPL02119.1 hypothetical protein CLV26_10444 [Parapedobacter indicus]SFI45980.1 hypothetical protein SAMN05444682_10444 [Parapedobacter indicus]